VNDTPLYVKDGDVFQNVAQQPHGNYFQVTLNGDHSKYSTGTISVPVYTDTEGSAAVFSLDFVHPGAFYNPLPCSTETIVFWVLAIVVYNAMELTFLN